MGQSVSNLTDHELIILLMQKVDSQSECLKGLEPLLQQMRIDNASFVATSKANNDALDKRISKVENVNSVWNVVNTIGAVLAGVIGFKT